jgi:curved DNA-binding protein CbpA
MTAITSTETTMTDLYSLLNVDPAASMEEIHKQYKKLSSAFHPDKLPPSVREKRDEVQKVFLEFKLASKFKSLIQYHKYIAHL